MKFCTNCDNMYYIGINANNSNQLNYYCRNCGNKDDGAAEEGMCVLKTQLKKGEQKFNHIVNQYTKLDPTLPRIYTMKCPNNECGTNKQLETGKKEKENEVIYMRYDDDNLKYLYICVHCDTTWKTDDLVAV